LTGLLVSVRSVTEAEAALAGGATLIDVKEPSRGSLGRADPGTLRAVIASVAGRRPVSAALGELLERNCAAVPEGLAYVKWGLAGCGALPDWRRRLTDAAEAMRKAVCGPVAVAYADWWRAGAPTPEDVGAFACGSGFAAFLIDTWDKDGSTLLDWLARDEILRLTQECRRARVRVALAGSLGVAEIAALLPLAPDWFAVRGAVCRGGRRDQAVEADRVRQLASRLDPAATPATSGS
jgi:uncharacterized protein (UPF0264 family)